MIETLLSPGTGRVVNIGLAIACLAIMATRFPEWKRMPRGRSFHWASSFLVCVSFLYGSLDLLLDWGNEVLRIALSTFALLWVLAALRFADRRRYGRRRSDYDWRAPGADRRNPPE